jgi:regulatory protein
MRVNNIGIEKAFQKITQYCAYQERSHYEVKEKLYTYGLYKNEVEELLSRLINENYLNEERFAIAFAGGKFRTKGWGRVKIKYELKQKRVSEYCIKKALSAIDTGDYEKKLNRLYAEKKIAIGSEKNIFVKKGKIRSYLLQKGYETSLISALLNQENTSH